MNEIKKYESDDLVYVLGQIPTHILMLIFFGLVFFNEYKEVFYFKILVGFGVFVLLLDLFNLIIIFKEIVRSRIGIKVYALKNIFKDKKQYKITSLDNMRTIAILFALTSLFLLPEIFQKSLFSNTLTLMLIIIGILSSLASLMLSRFIYKSRN